MCLLLIKHLFFFHNQARVLAPDIRQCLPSNYIKRKTTLQQTQLSGVKLKKALATNILNLRSAWFCIGLFSCGFSFYEHFDLLT